MQKLKFVLILTLTIYSVSHAQINIHRYYHIDNIPVIVKFLADNEEKTTEITDDVFNIIKSTLEDFSPNISDNYINSLNKRAKSNYTRMNPDLSILVSKSLFYNRLTSGLIDITLGRVYDLWGFPNKNYYLPKLEEISNEIRNSGFKYLNISGNSIFIRNKNLKFNFYPFYIGLALEKAKNYFTSHGIKNFFISINYDFSVMSSDKETWTIGIPNPLSESSSEFIEFLKLKNGSVAISGVHRNRFRSGLNIYHEIINPKTGKPLDTELLLVTVVHNNPIDAVFLSRAILLLGEHGGLRLAEKNSITAMFIKFESGNYSILKTKSWAKKFDKLENKKPVKNSKTPIHNRN